MKQLGGDVPSTTRPLQCTKTFVHDGLIHVLRSCHSISTQSFDCDSPNCHYGHDLVETRAAIQQQFLADRRFNINRENLRPTPGRDGRGGLSKKEKKARGEQGEVMQNPSPAIEAIKKDMLAKTITANEE
ncbi:hypothetical protein DIS24_g630 [Lasiodiplodia hormozganensis]|uniref:Uncharacterized protein n=1 Tax=Lasiodiplodia hormozganensis TaxID=869390 RepID=A0AA39Z5A8_9PEZI|nr:hypothetical protein DIS24_g630 [Lasiodiplodia hormozganensis]